MNNNKNIKEIKKSFQNEELYSELENIIEFISPNKVVIYSKNNIKTIKNG